MKESSCSAESFVEVLDADLGDELVDAVDLVLLLLPGLQPQGAQVRPHLSLVQLLLVEAGQLLVAGLDLAL
jgi:hypothetical protein